MNSATKARRTQIVVWLIWAIACAVFLLLPEQIIQSRRIRLDVPALPGVVTYEQRNGPPWFQVADWVARTVLVSVLRIPASKFNDDRLARTLDAISEHTRDIWQDVVHHALRKENAYARLASIARSFAADSLAC